jgi:hypothetical protein
MSETPKVTIRYRHDLKPPLTIFYPKLSNWAHTVSRNYSQVPQPNSRAFDDYLRRTRKDPLHAYRKQREWLDAAIDACPNVIDLRIYRRIKVAVEVDQALHHATPVGYVQSPSNGVRCSVKRPGQSFTEPFDFLLIPKKGEEVVLGFELKVYVVESILHLAAEAGSGFGPSIRIQLRVRKRKH